MTADKYAAHKLARVLWELAHADLQAARKAEAGAWAAYDQAVRDLLPPVCAGCGNEAAGNVDWQPGWRCRSCAGIDATAQASR
jgi:hypothetical protein